MLGKASDRCLAFVDLLCSSFPFESFESCPAVRLCMLWRVLTGILTCFPIMSQLIHSSNPGRLCSAALLFFFQGEGKSASRELHVQEPSAASSMARRFRGFGGHARWSSMIQSNMSNMSNICPTETIEIQSTYSMKQHYDIHWHSILVHICSRCLFGLYLCLSLCLSLVQFLDLRCKSWKRSWTSRRGSIQSSLAPWRGCWIGWICWIHGVHGAMANRIVGLSSWDKLR